MSFTGITTDQLMAVHPAHARDSWERGPSRRSGIGANVATKIGLVELAGLLNKPRMVAAREQIRNLANDESVLEIVLLVDSPGGTVSGTHDLYLTVAEAAKRKRVTAFIEDLGASGAYYAVSAATEIVMNATGVAGSIGVYVVLTDASRALQAEGVDVLVVRSGPYKGTATWGAKISQAEIDQVQHFVDAQARHFIAAVAKGRGMSVKRVSELADGRVFLGAEAVAVRLVDRIDTFDNIASEAMARRAASYMDLEGRAAVDQFDQLVEAHGGSVALAKAQVQGRYPLLAANAKVARRQLGIGSYQMVKGYKVWD
jgi:signal peptide peptidase SppA